MKQVISMFLAFALLLGVMPMMVHATAAQTQQNTSNMEAIDDQSSANVVASGTCGNNAYWTLNDTGGMVVYGTGAMTQSPWEERLCH